MLVQFIYITRLASKEELSPSNKIYQEVGRAKDLSAPRKRVPTAEGLNTTVLTRVKGE
jgi:hypothetical protein